MATCSRTCEECGHTVYRRLDDEPNTAVGQAYGSRYLRGAYRPPPRSSGAPPPW